MNHTLAMLIAVISFLVAAFLVGALTGHALAGQQFGMPNDFNSRTPNSEAYGGYHENYQSPQNDARYRQYETERHNRQQYRDNY